MMKFTVEIVPTDGGGYRARCPALPGCHASGHTAADAERLLRDAIVGYLASWDVAVPGSLELECHNSSPPAGTQGFGLSASGPASRMRIGG